MTTEEISVSEAEIEVDAAFADNELIRLPFAQCAWTILSVTEDHHFKITVAMPLETEQAKIYVDGLLNSLTYPLRVCYSNCVKGSFDFDRRLVDHHYGLADKWLERAEDYAHFNTMFPLYHAKEIELHVRGTELIPTDWSTADLSYEAYDRLVDSRDPESEAKLDANLVGSEIMANMKVSHGVYSIAFTRRLMNALQKTFAGVLRDRHVLPNDWQFTYFSLKQYREVFICLQFMAYAWFAGRQIAITSDEAAYAVAYSSSVWTPKKGLLVTTIARHTGLPKALVEIILRYLTFGEMNIRNPDIAIQPIVDLSNSQFAISPFVIMNINAERNLCVLLNQIPEERKIYSQLVDEKEAQARAETIVFLEGLDLDYCHGQLESTDLDLAIIDRKSKICLCLEIKWFIEPAEVREIISRSIELRKGVTQALKITEMFTVKDQRLFKLLDIDDSYDFQAMVGSVNFIGSDRVQHPQIPITKLWHVANEIKLRGNLKEVLNWLRQRDYLPKRDVDYKVHEVAIESGRWRSKWYGIMHA